MKKKRNRTQNNKTDESVQNEYTNENKKEEKKIRKHLHDNNNNYEFEENYSVIMSVRFSRISRGPHAWCGGECECVCALCSNLVVSIFNIGAIAKAAVMSIDRRYNGDTTR